MQSLIGAFVVAVALLFGGCGRAVAASADFVFDAVTQKVPLMKDAIISIRLRNKTTGRAVTDAVIFQTRLDMSPDNMAEMTSPLTPLPPSEPGVYRFLADIEMAGRWMLKLAAKVPGEQETVRGEVVIVVVK